MPTILVQVVWEKSELACLPILLLLLSFFTHHHFISHNKQDNTTEIITTNTYLKTHGLKSQIHSQKEKKKRKEKKRKQACWISLWPVAVYIQHNKAACPQILLYSSCYLAAVIAKHQHISRKPQQHIYIDIHTKTCVWSLPKIQDMWN